MVGISFKISKSGTRYSPKLSTPKTQKPDSQAGSHGLSSNQELATKRRQSDETDGPYSPFKKSRREVALRSTDGEPQRQIYSPLSRKVPKDAEASFAVNLFLDGFSIDKPTEKGKFPPLATEVMELQLLPYDRNAGDFLRAIDGGWIPNDLLEDIPCKYINGCVICQLRDYRGSLQSSIGESVTSFSRKGRDRECMPTVHRVVLQPTTVTILKDILSMADDSWSYEEYLVSL